MLALGTPVATSVIDAHAGGLGVIGAVIEGEAPDVAEARGITVYEHLNLHLAGLAAGQAVPGAVAGSAYPNVTALLLLSSFKPPF